MLRRHRLPEGPPLTHLQLDPPAGGEVLTGAIPPSHCRELLAATDGPFLLHGGGRFELATISPSASDALLARLPGFGAHAAVAAGAAGRRGRGTPLDPGQQRLCEALARALDPNGTLV